MINAGTDYVPGMGNDALEFNRMGLYVVYDTVAHESGPVFEARNDRVALRNYDILMKDIKYRSDYHLLFLGSIDHQSNLISPAESDHRVITSEIALETPEE